MKYTAGTVVKLRYPLIKNEINYPEGTEGVVSTYSESNGEVSYQLHLRDGERLSVLESCLSIGLGNKENYVSSTTPKSDNLKSTFATGDVVQLRFTVLHGIARFSKGAVGTIVSWHYNSVSGHYYGLKMLDGRVLETVQNNLKLFADKPQPQSPRIISLTDKNVSCIYTVEVLMETDESYFCRNSQQQEKVYLKSEWDILEGGDQIAAMVHSTSHCIRICDAIEIYKAGFRKVEV